MWIERLRTYDGCKKILMYCFILGGGKGCGRGVYVRNSSQEDIVVVFFFSKLLPFSLWLRCRLRGSKLESARFGLIIGWKIFTYNSQIT